MGRLKFCIVAPVLGKSWSIAFFLVVMFELVAILFYLLFNNAAFNDKMVGSLVCTRFDFIFKMA